MNLFTSVRATARHISRLRRQKEDTGRIADALESIQLSLAVIVEREYGIHPSDLHLYAATTAAVPDTERDLNGRDGASGVVYTSPGDHALREAEDEATALVTGLDPTYVRTERARADAASDPVRELDRLLDRTYHP